MVVIENLTTYYSFILAILIFIASKYLDSLDEIRKIILNGVEEIKDNKMNYNGIEIGMRWKIFEGFVIFSGILLDFLLLLNSVFSLGLIIPYGNIILVILILISIILVFIQPIINNLAIAKMAYKGNVGEVFENLVKGKKQKKK